MIPEKLSRFYIGGGWVEPLSETRLPVEDPATEAVLAQLHKKEVPEDAAPETE